ncbi:MAG: hypothetical protein AB7G13_05640 [Lautropia sp.]
MLLLACAIVGALLLGHASPLLFSDDGVQYLSGAISLAQHGTYATSVLFYESQVFQAFPALQTVFPPGLSSLTAAVSQAMGILPETAVIAINVAAHVATALLIFTGMGRLGVRPALRLAGALTWLLYVTAWHLVIGGLSEPLYVLLLVGSWLALGIWQTQASSSDPLEAAARRLPSRWLLAAVVLQSLAVVVRYQAIAFAPALGVAIALFLSRRTPRRSRATTIAVAAGAGAVPVLVLLALLGRNWLLTGNLTSGTNSFGPKPLWDVVYDTFVSLYWSLGFRQIWLTALMATIAAICLAALAAARRRGHLVIEFDRARFWNRRSNLIVYGLLGIVFNFALVALLSSTSSEFFVTTRYVIIGFPILLVLVALLLDDVEVRLNGRRIAFTRVCTVALGIYALVQMASGIPRLLDLGNDGRTSELIRLFERQQHDAVAVSDATHGAGATQLLASIARERAVVMANLPHSLFLMLRHSALGPSATGDRSSPRVIGVPTPAFSSRPWTAANIRELSLRHGVSYVIVSRFDVSRHPMWKGDYLQDLLGSSGEIDWIEPLWKSNDLFIGSLVSPLLAPAP